MSAQEGQSGRAATIAGRPSLTQLLRRAVQIAALGPDWNRQRRLHQHHTCKDPAQPEKRVCHDVEIGGVCQSPVIHWKLSPSRLLILEHRSVDSC